MIEKNCKKNVDVSIIVPLFHGGQYLDNILQMTRKNIENAVGINIELVLVNDSPDDVPDFSKITSKECQAEIVLNESNLGIQRARLRGVDYSHGKYLLFLDQDDAISDNMIAKMYEYALNGNIPVSDWKLELLKDDGICSVDRITDTGSFSLSRFCRGGNVIGPPGHCLIKREYLPVCWTKKIMQINGADDVLLWMGLLAEGRSFVRCDEKLYIHKWNSESFSNDSANMLESENEAFELAADEYGISGFWCWIHKRSINYRKRISADSKRGNNSILRRRACLLLYPEILIPGILYRLKTYVEKNIFHHKQNK